MTTLLITNIPPCPDIAVGMALDRLCRLFPPEELAIFSVADPRLETRPSPDLPPFRFRHHDRPREHWRVFPSVPGTAFTWLMESYTASVTVPRIAAEAIRFGREVKAKRVWCTLDGQTAIRLALPVAQGLGVPLFTHVWDPPHGTLLAKELDAWSASSVHKRFEESIRASAACAAISIPMAEHYAATYGTRTVALLPGQENIYARPPATAPHDREEWIIGTGGQLYCPEAWNALVEALQAREWRLLGRPVRLRLTGRRIRLETRGSMRMEWLGWRTSADAARLMEECDLLYCPCWWDPVQEPQIRYSFPSKLPTLLASGRPVFFHGPDYAAPARFLREAGAGALCHSTDPDRVATALESILGDPEAYARAARKGREAFDRSLTLETMRKKLAEFLGLPLDHFLPVPTCSAGEMK